MRHDDRHSSSPHSLCLDGDHLTLEDLVAIARGRASVTLDPTAIEGVQRARDAVERRLQRDETFYGINTGFGYLAEVRIEPHLLEQLQVNLIRSHACGVGRPLPPEVVRAVLALRIQTMLRGNSGIRPETVALMADLLNADICPVIPEKGSVGASGDLAPLAHLALVLIGEGEVWQAGEIRPAREVLAAHGLTPLSPQAKEGLCLINGTQVMTALGLLLAHDAQQLFTSADIIAAMSCDAVKGSPNPFRAEIQAVRPHPGQVTSASNLRLLLAEDAIRESHVHCRKVQDPYSIRCTPQVHGAIRGAWSHVLDVLITEANSSTDNPLVFPDDDTIFSGGNFHGEPVALALDYLAIAMSELASISERRIEKLINPHMSGLPAFLAKESGLHSGHMITHVVAAALVTENKVLSHPASVDAISTSADKEDHVSMGLTAALKLRSIIENVSKVLAIEAIAAADGLDFHAPLQGGVGVEGARRWVRERCAPLDEDRSLSKEIERVAEALLTGSLVSFVEAELGTALA